jgi:glyceraldehyde-3-phosphate dehydrogenase/erythrose-4-phosphate dehydrogenase
MSYDTVSMYTPKYLKWLESQFIDAGGQVIEHTSVEHIDELFSNESSKVDFVVNCTGLGNLKLKLQRMITGLICQRAKKGLEI